MSNQHQRNIASNSSRCNENRVTRPLLAPAYQAIVNRAADAQPSAGQPDDLLDYLSELLDDPYLAKACQEWLERQGPPET
jgi:hypothetical protein